MSELGAFHESELGQFIESPMGARHKLGACYCLENCNPGGLIKYSETAALSSYVGEVVLWNDECWTVSEVSTCGTPVEAVTVSGTYESCADCWDSCGLECCQPVSAEYYGTYVYDASTQCCLSHNEAAGAAGGSRVLVDLDLTQDDPTIGEADCCDDLNDWFSGSWEMQLHHFCNVDDAGDAGVLRKGWLSTATVSQSCSAGGAAMLGEITYQGGTFPTIHPDDRPHWKFRLVEPNSGLVAGEFPWVEGIAAPYVQAYGGDCCGGVDLEAAALPTSHCGTYTGTMTVEVLDNGCGAGEDAGGSMGCLADTPDCDDDHNCEDSAP